MADPYADAAHTARQRAYARRLDTRRVYTPQVVVNGTAETVGSRGRAVADLVTAALARPAAATATLTVLPSESQNAPVRVRVTVDGLADDAAAGAAVRAVLLSRTVGNAVPRGENGGRTLSHAMTARATETALLSDGRAVLSLDRPAGGGGEDGPLLVAAFVQVGEAGRVLAATAPVPVEAN